MLLFRVPEEMRRAKIEKVLAMDYYAIGKQMLEDFKSFTEEEHRKAVDEMLATLLATSAARKEQSPTITQRRTASHRRPVPNVMRPRAPRSDTSPTRTTATARRRSPARSAKR